jgi:hypothetical protein
VRADFVNPHELPRRLGGLRVNFKHEDEGAARFLCR